MSSNKVTNESLDRTLARVGPITLPMQAYGPVSITWVSSNRPLVWAWVQWPSGPATREAAVVAGHNDRVVGVEFQTPTGTCQVTVWRNAVRQRPSS